MATVVLDYKTYSEILQRADRLVQKDQRGMTRLDALRKLMQDSPADEAVRAAYDRLVGTSTPQERTKITKQEQPMPSPQPPAQDTLLTSIAKRQADDSSLTYQQASDAVLHEHPHLHTDYVLEMRYPQPQPHAQAVAKQTPPGSTAIIKAVRARAESQGTSCQQAFVATLQEHDGKDDFRDYHEAYRKYVTHDGIEDWDRERIAKFGGEQGS